VRDGTRVIRAGLPEAEQGTPFLPGPTFAAPFHLRGDPEGVDYVYGRYGSPTWTAYERALSELEGGEAVLFASGMAAASAVLLTELRPGDTAVIPSDCYMHVRGLASGYLAERGIEVRLYPTAELSPDALPPDLCLLWIETPSNPGLEVCDVRGLASAARERGAITAVDNTTATPLGQRPLELGADLSVSSATKHLSGHADLLLGYVAARDPERAEGLRGWRRESGGIAGPFETWLAHRSLPTLALRMERASANALALAEALSKREDVLGVRYPGLPGDLAHEVARRQMSGFGSVLAFDLGSRERAERFLQSAELVSEATSFGSVHTTAERRLRWGSDDVPEGFIRLSAGCEETTDLVADVERALEGLRPSP
jgi:cystathionine gamma-lyase